jgi:hypothetical protein
MKRNYTLSLLFFISLLFFPNVIFGQNASAQKDSAKVEDCEILDFNDVMRLMVADIKKKKEIKSESKGDSKKNENPNKEENKEEKASEKKEKKVSLLVLPTISFNPTNGFLFGATSTVVFNMGPKKTTQMSSINARIVYTTKSQLMTYIKSNIYTKNDDYFFEGDWRFYLYQLPTYGLGTNAPDTVFEPNFDFEEVEHAGGGGSYPMKYNFVIFHQIVNKKIVDHVYAGIGYQLENYWNIRDELLNLDTVPKQLTPHYVYSEKYGFDSSSYATSGISVNFMYDSRDNPINAYSGYYFKLNYRMNPTFLGSSRNSTELYFEFRTYVGLSKKTPRHLIAFWLWGNFQMSGRLPYYSLKSLGDDQKATSGRGYIAGRFRGKDFLYGEVEYRFPILKCAQTLGGVIFLNATTASNEFTGVKLFDYVRPAAGVGLRILMNKNTRLNITIDYAIGWKSQGVYFGSPDVF